MCLPWPSCSVSNIKEHLLDTDSWSARPSRRGWHRLFGTHFLAQGHTRGSRPLSFTDLVWPSTLPTLCLWSQGRCAKNPRGTHGLQQVCAGLGHLAWVKSLAVWSFSLEGLISRYVCYSLNQIYVLQCIYQKWPIHWNDCLASITQEVRPNIH